MDPIEDSIENIYMIFLHNCSRKDFRHWTFVSHNQAQKRLSHTKRMIPFTEYHEA